MWKMFWIKHSVMKNISFASLAATTFVKIADNQKVEMLFLKMSDLENKLSNVCEVLKKKTLWPLFINGVQLPQGFSHFKVAVYFLPFSSQKFLLLILSTS